MYEKRMAQIVKEFGAEKIIINSAADWGVSDPLMVPKTVELMLSEGIEKAVVEKIVWDNPFKFFNQSGRLNCLIDNKMTIDQSRLHEGNSVLRGQDPVIQ